jgi:hypothetical protein
MTALSGQQHFKFRITGVTGNTFQSTTKQNVKKRVEKILYLETPPADAVRLSYVGSKELSPANNLFIGDRSDSLYANSRTGRIQEFRGTNSPITVKNTNFIVTQVFNEADSGSIPLYFKHILPTTIVAESVRIYDQDFNPVSTDKYKLEIQQTYDESTGYPVSPAVYTGYHLYNNLESTYDATTGEYAVYFVQYTSTAGTTEVTETELLSNELAYREATFEDIWHATLELKPWIKAYQWDPSTLSIKMPASGEFSVQYQESKRIKVSQPIALDDTHPWFPRVINGTLVTGYAGLSVNYSMPEFENQAFNPLEPYKLAVRVGAEKIADHLVKLQHEDLRNASESSIFSYFYLLFENSNGVVVYAVTDDPTTVNTEYRDFDNNRVLDSDGNAITWSSDTLLGLDQLAGIVHVSFDIDDSYEIWATYSYKEYHYEMSGLNMNPVFDTQAHKELRSVYLIPESTMNNNEGIQTQGLHWIKNSPSGLITGASQNGDGGNENIAVDTALKTTAGYGVNGVIGMHYSWRATTTITSDQEIIANKHLEVASTTTFPYKGWIRFLDSSNYYRYARFVGRTDTTLILSSSQSEVADEVTGLVLTSGTTIELVNFIDERTTLTNRTISESSNIPSGYPPHYSRYFLLAEMSINPAHSHNDCVRIDVREDGGGVIASKYDEAKKLNPKVQWLSDFGDFDGQVYPGNSVIVVKLPVALLDRYSENQLYDLVEQNIPFGVQPIIRYFGYTPNILYVGPGE